MYITAYSIEKFNMHLLFPVAFCPSSSLWELDLGKAEKSRAMMASCFIKVQHFEEFRVSVQKKRKEVCFLQMARWQN